MRPEWFLPFALLAACGTETGNPEGLSLELGYNARSSQPEVVALDGDGQVRVDTVWLRLNTVEVETSCPAGPSQVFDGLGFADHGGDEAAVQRLDVSAEPLCSVTTTAEPGPGGTDEPPSVNGASVALEGWLDDGRPFMVRLDEPVALRVTLNDEVPPDDGRWLMSFDVATWLDASALRGLSDEALMDGGALPGLVDQLVEGVSLHLDLDEDGVVDDDEPRLDVPR